MSETFIITQGGTKEKKKKVFLPRATSATLFNQISKKIEKENLSTGLTVWEGSVDLQILGNSQGKSQSAWSDIFFSKWLIVR